MSKNPPEQSPSASLDLINPAGLYDPSSHAYSHIALCQGPGRFSFIAGQGGETEDGNLPESFHQQVEQALDNLASALTAVQADFSQLAKITLLIVAHDQAKLGIWSRAFNTRLAGRPAPACTLIPVPRLALDKMLIEIDAVVWQTRT